jgi:UDP-glucose 4-epimerase
MRVVITGASGNIGSQLVQQLLAHPDVTSVVGIARRLPPPTDGVEWQAADIASSDLRPIVRGADVVVHLAWLLVPARRPNELESVNVHGTARLLDAVAAEGVPAFVQASSVGAYSGGPKERVPETHPTGGIPTSLYSRQKAAVERQLDAFEQQHPERRVVRIRPAIVMQPDAASSQARYLLGPLIPQGLVPHLPVVPRTPRLEFQIVHTEDVARAFAAAVTRPVSGAFNIAGEPVVNPEVLAETLGARQLPVPAALLRGMVDLTWRMRVLSMDPGWIDMGLGTPLMDTIRARRELDWAPCHDTRDTLRAVVDAMGQGRGGNTPVLRPRAVGVGRVTETLRVMAGTLRR